MGKGTIAAALVASVPGLWLSRSWTTRPRRPQEPPDAYRFVDGETFDAQAAAGGFLEWAEVFGHRYATPWPSPPAGRDVLLEIDVQGAGQVKGRHPDAVVVFVEAPSRQEQEARLRGRGDPEEVVARRLAGAEDEERAGRALADHVVVNDDLDRAVSLVAGIVAAERARPGASHQRPPERSPHPDPERK